MCDYYNTLDDMIKEKIYDIISNKKEDYDSLKFLGNIIEYFYEDDLITFFEDFDTEQDINYQFKIWAYYNQ